MKKYHEITDLSVTEEKLLITIDGRNYEFLLSELSERIMTANASEREKIEISPSGYGLHWPLIDEDLSIDGLLGIKHAPPKTNQQKVSA